jgi:hypothetical protein
MELSKRTLGVLKLFASVNENLVFKAGKTQRTISTDEGVFVEAEIDEELPRDFPICGLATFLRNLEAAEKTSFDLGEKVVTIAADASKLKYGYGAANLIKSPPDKSLVIPASAPVASIPKDKVALVMKIAEINSLPHIGLGSDGTNFYLTAFDKKNPDSSSTRIVLGDASGAAWEEAFTYERFSKIVPADYEAKVVEGKFTSFVGDRLTFSIAVDKTK